MTIDEAIKVLEGFFVKNQAQPGKDIWEASKLGIKGLEQVKKYRELKVGYYADLLPGETKD